MKAPHICGHHDRSKTMKRLHIHIAVNELSESINFYSTLFNSPPSIEKNDYAKWDLSDPAVNFAISESDGQSNGINHLGIQVDSDDELEEIAQRFDDAEIASSTQQDASCCYANSNKHWSQDPQGIAWESFHTMKNIPMFSVNTKTDTKNNSSNCCTSNEGSTNACCS